MALTDCLKTALDAGEITQQQHDMLAQRFERFRKTYALASGSTAAENAKQALLDELKAETAHRKRKAKLTVQMVRARLADLDGYRTAGGRKDVGEAALMLLEHHGEARFQSVAGLQRAIVGQAHARMEALLYKFRRSAVLGDVARHNRPLLTDVVRELFGEATGSAEAKAFADAWTQTAEWLRQRFNAAGGAIGKLENWGLPQRHDARALRKAGQEAWKAAITPRLDLSRMQHPLTKMPVTAGELSDILDEIYLSTVTDGWASRKPAHRPAGRGALANQHAEHRFLVFKSADDWLAYQRDFGGGGDPFATMMGHINTMARDIAAMEILGPNPDMGLEWLKQVVTKEAHLAAAGASARIPGDPRRALDRARRIAHRLDAVWGSMRGTLDTPVSASMAAIVGGVRDWVTASALGTASISSLSDVGTSLVARRFAGVSGGPFRDIVKAFTPATRREAVAAGLILDSAAHVLSAQARYVGTIGGPTWTRYLADRVLTWSLLTPWTQAAKHAFGLAFFHEAARQAGRSWAELHPAFRATFERHGITPNDWQQIRRAPRHVMQNGVEILRPAEIAASGRGAGGEAERLAEKWLAMVQAETEFAVPDTTHRSRTVLIGESRPGTVTGEVLRSFAQFKSFAAVYAMLHGGRIARMLMAGEKGSAAKYAVSLLLASMGYGALSVQLHQIAALRDPRPLDSPEFWGAAMLQGGGLGIYGDFLFSDLNRYGRGLPETLAGPVAQRAGDFLNLTLGNAIVLGGNLFKPADERVDPHFGRELVQFARGNVPGGNVFYVRLAWERLVLDQMQKLLDPEAEKAFRRRQQEWQRDFRQGFWWAPGTAAPERAPDFGNLVQ